MAAISVLLDGVVGNGGSWLNLQHILGLRCMESEAV